MRGLIQSLTLGLALTGRFAGSGWCAPASSLDTKPAITIHINDYADVNRSTLIEAERVAAGIFRKAGVESRWEDYRSITNGTAGSSPDPRLFILSDIQLGILPRRMADRLGLPDGALGVAPGAETGRHLAYVFYDSVATLPEKLTLRRVRGDVCELPSTAQILGSAMAHEIGHLLLNLEAHSDLGIMRANWDIRTLKDACFGYLLFTREQAEEMRTEVQRRLGDLEASRREQKPAAPPDSAIITLE